MGVKISPVVDADIRNRAYGVVATPSSEETGMGENTTTSSSIFGTAKDEELPGWKETPKRFYQRGYISLAIPIPNLFALGKDADTLKIILGNSNVSKIVDGSIIYDAEDRVYIQASDLDSSLVYSDVKDRYLLGGVALRHLIEEFDVEEAITEMLWKVIVKALKKSTADSIKNLNDVESLGSLQYGSGDIWIVDHYYFSPRIPVNAEVFKEFVADSLKDELFKAEGRLAYLFAVKRRPGLLRSMIMSKLFLLPIGYRPDIKRRRDPMTKEYNAVVIQNRKLQEHMNANATLVRDIRDQYRRFIEEIKVLYFDRDQSRAKYRVKNFVSLVDGLKGKNGLIRSRMQGVRSDYTGRSVITVDPAMSVDTVGIPFIMAETISELLIMAHYKTQSAVKKAILSSRNQVQRRKILKEIFRERYAVIGRQPTLHALSIQAFKVRLVEGNAIVLNPLVTPPFNADFDGDQMHVSVAITDEANEELKRIMNSLNNLFLPRNGECHVAPRHEIIYGLWKASTIEIDKSKEQGAVANTFEGRGEFVDKVVKQLQPLSAPVLFEGKVMSAGVAAIHCCLPQDFVNVKLGHLPITQSLQKVDGAVSEAWFKQLLGEVAKVSKTHFVQTVNELVRLGFAVADIYPPEIGVLHELDVSEIVSEFEKTIEVREELYNRGFETDESYASFYSDAYAELDSRLQKTLKKMLKGTDGFLDLIESKAHASMSNVMQMFGVKGRVKKNDEESFNAIIQHSLVQQLTGLEQFVTAYGSREGIVEKSIETYGPGYTTRLLSHTANIISIKTEDCGTKDGIEISYNLVKQFLPRNKMVDDLVHTDQMVREYIVKLLAGRYIVERPRMIRDEKEAGEIYDQYISPRKSGKQNGYVKLRSPISCACPCCARCYGLDLGQQAKVAVGTAIGYIAAESIGEPATQLSMKNFQSGGIAGVKNLTSSFDQIRSYFELVSHHKTGTPLTYDMLAPEDGIIRTVSNGDGTKTIKLLTDESDWEKNAFARSKVRVYEDVRLKQHVNRGENMQVQQGELDVKEILEYHGLRSAQQYLALKVYSIFKEEVFVNLKHFEVIVAGMTSYFCLRGNEYFKTGCAYTVVEYQANDRAGCEFMPELIGIKRAPLFRNDALSGIFMENIELAVRRAVLLSGEDSLTSPTVRATLGLHAGVGNDVEGFIEKRGQERV